MRGVTFGCAASMLALAACASTHDPALDAAVLAVDAPVDGAIDAAPMALDGDVPEAIREIARFTLAGDVFDAAPTSLGDLCVVGMADGDARPTGVADGDTFVACYGAMGLTRVRSWPCTYGAFPGATMIAASPSGDLFVIIEGTECVGTPSSIRVERLDASLTTRASWTLTTPGGYAPYLRAMDASDDVVVLGGMMRGTTMIATSHVLGPALVVLDAHDLSIRRVVGNPLSSLPDSWESELTSVALRDGVVLVAGGDVPGGAFVARGGSFEETLALPDGAPTNVTDPGRWDSQYQVLWSASGLPTMLGIEGGGTQLSVALGATTQIVPSQYLGAPTAAFRDETLLIARPFEGTFTVAGRAFVGDGVSGTGAILIALDSTLTALWGRRLTPGYDDYQVDVLSDGTISVLAHIRIDGADPFGMSLVLYR